MFFGRRRPRERSDASNFSPVQLDDDAAAQPPGLDDEMFWISAVLGGDDRAIAGLHDGWASEPMTGAEAINMYKREIARSDEALAKIDLDAPPCWWPPATMFDEPPMSNGREVLFRVLAETSVHAGHLDIVRELIDGHQNLVVE